MQKKIIIFGDPKRRYATEAMERFLAFACGKVEILANCFDGSCDIDTLRHADFAVVFGGDGTILSAARDLCEADVPVIGVNVGTLGFLAEFGPDELLELFDKVSDDPSLIERRMILSCRIERDAKEYCNVTAVNDVVISAGEPFNMIEMKISVTDQPVATGALVILDGSGS